MTAGQAEPLATADSVARFGGLLADRSRAVMCLAMLDGRAWTAKELVARARSRPLVRTYLDWTERRTHLGGALGAAVRAQLLERRWITGTDALRAVLVTRPVERACTNFSDSISTSEPSGMGPTVPACVRPRSRRFAVPPLRWRSPAELSRPETWRSRSTLATVATYCRSRWRRLTIP